MFQAIGDFFSKLFFTSISNMTFIDIILAILFTCIAVVIIKKILGLFRGIKKIGYNVTHYSRVKCSKIQCPTCGRTLDRCVCSANQGKSYRKRIKAYKKARKG